MDQRRWLQIEEVLQQALDVQPHQRAEFLKHTCNGDLSLLAEVEALLKREAEAGSFMESPAIASLPRAEPPSQISHYRIDKRIGSGGMGEVFKAHDETLRRVVALKMLPGEFTSDEARVRRFEHEAFAASRLNHPNIITIFEITHEGDSHFIVEEIVEGRTLRDLLRDPDSGKVRPLELERTLDIAIQIARALKAAHTAWIIHRDIKPENVMVRDDGLVKVLDFGIAKLDDDRASFVSSHDNMSAAQFKSEAPLLTVPGMIMGTASYMSPEQARGEPLDGRTDVFSLGMVLYEMLTGVQLFAGTTRSVVLERLKQSENIVGAGIKSGNIPKELQRILRRALQSDREERYASAGEFLDDLINFRGRLERRTTRRMVGVSALALVLALAIAGVAAFLSVQETWVETVMRDGHTAAVRRAVFSPDGKWLVSVSEDRRVIVWDFARRMPVKTLDEHTGVVNTVAFSPDGKWFITGDEQQTAILWDANQLEKHTVWRDERGPIRAASFSPDGQVVVYAAGSVAIVRETGTWKKLHELPCHLPFGDFLFPEAGLVKDNYGRSWDLYTGQSLRVIEEDWAGTWAALSPDRKQLASVDSRGHVRLVDIASRKVIKDQHGHHDHGRAVAYSPDGRLLATGAERVVLWDSASMTRVVPLEYESVVWSVAFSPDGRWLVSTHGDGSILVWDVANRELAADLRQHSGGVRSVAFSPDGTRLATASEDHSVILWDSSSGRKQAVLRQHETRVGAVAFSPDGRWIVSADQSAILFRYDLGRGEPRMLIVPPKMLTSYCVVVSPDGRYVATTSRIYSAETGEEVARFGQNQVYSAVFTADGRLLIGVTDQAEVVMLETASWRVVGRQKWSDTPIVSLSISPDGNYLVTGDDGGKVRLGTVNPFQQLAVVGEHSARIKAVAFSPDGKRVASAGDDKMVALWDVSSRKLVSTIGTHTSPIYALAFSPDGRRLMTGEHDSSVRQYSRRRSLWGFSLD